MMARMSAAPILYHLLAELVVVAHLVFVLFVLFGGLLAARCRAMLWLHLSAATWGAFVEFSGWICPLTPLEIRLREKAGEAGSRSDFVARYLLPLLYPEGLTRDAQVALGMAVIVVNLLIYSWILRRYRKTRG
jgi:hypothetical protein